jgi:hypothetical protein
MMILACFHSIKLCVHIWILGKKLPSFFFIQKGMAFSDDGKVKV